MFNFGRNANELVILGLFGLGLFAQNNELNLANNTTVLLLLLFILQGQAEIEELRQEICCIERERDDHRGCRNGDCIEIQRNGSRCCF